MSSQSSGALDPTLPGLFKHVCWPAFQTVWGKACAFSDVPKAGFAGVGPPPGLNNTTRRGEGLAK